ncbi:hypothetical protein BLOT_000278 [Blomia tropicalis]|nr:hypothetical protein BLOT_000278 [Blomia tropicalis]
MNKWDTCCKILENAFKMLFKRRSNTCNVGMVPIGRSFSDRKVAPNKYPAKTDLTTKMQTNAHHFGDPSFNEKKFENLWLKQMKPDVNDDHQLFI